MFLGIAGSNNGDAVASMEDLREREVIFLEEERIFLVHNDGEPLALSADEVERRIWRRSTRNMPRKLVGFLTGKS